MTIAEDASTPAVTHSPYGTSGTATSPSFSPPANSLVVVLANLLLLSGGGGTVSCADSLSHAYTQVKGISNSVNATGSFIFTFRYASAPGPITVTVTDSSTASAQRFQLAPRVLTGAAASQSGGGGNQASGSGITMNQLATTTTVGP